MFERLLASTKTETGKCMVSAVIGLGLAAIFHDTCEGLNCLEFKGASPQTVVPNTFEHDSVCYRFTPTSVTCGSTPKQIPFE